MSGWVVVRYCNNPTVCLKRRWPLSSRESLTGKQSLTSMGVSMGFRFQRPRFSSSVARYCCCEMMISPFSKYVRCMPRNKLRGPRSFNANSSPNLPITRDTNRPMKTWWQCHQRTPRNTSSSWSQRRWRVSGLKDFRWANCDEEIPETLEPSTQGLT